MTIYEHLIQIAKDEIEPLVGMGLSPISYDGLPVGYIHPCGDEIIFAELRYDGSRRIVSMVPGCPSTVTEVTSWVKKESHQYSIFCYYLNYLISRRDVTFFDENGDEISLTKKIVQKKLTKNGWFMENRKTYLMVDPTTGLTKIGMSETPQKRLKILGLDRRVTDWYVCDNLCEKELHHKYANNRTIGEWFNLTNEHIQSIVKEYGFVKQKSVRNNSKDSGR